MRAFLSNAAAAAPATPGRYSTQSVQNEFAPRSTNCRSTPSTRCEPRKAFNSDSALDTARSGIVKNLNAMTAANSQFFSRSRSEPPWNLADSAPATPPHFVSFHSGIRLRYTPLRAATLPPLLLALLLLG